MECTNINNAVNDTQKITKLKGKIILHNYIII